MIRIPFHAYAEAYVASLPDRKHPVTEIERVAHVLSSVSTLTSFIADPSVSIADRSKALQLAIDGISKETVHLVLLVAAQRQLKKMDRLVASVQEAYAKATKTSIAIATAAVPLTDKERKDISKALERKTGKHISLTERIDPNIGGGLLIQLGDWEFDATVAGRLRRMKHALTNV